MQMIITGHEEWFPVVIVHDVWEDARTEWCIADVPDELLARAVAAFAEFAAVQEELIAMARANGYEFMSAAEPLQLTMPEPKDVGGTFTNGDTLTVLLPPEYQVPVLS